MTRYLPAAFAAALALSGCSSMESAKVDYKAERKLPPLEIPPDLTTPARDDRFQVPETGKPAGAATLSAYNAERTAVAKPGSTAILPEIEKVRIERTASERWLVVPEPPEKVWPVVKEFWQEMGFLIKTEVPEAGVMETDWNENRAKIGQDGLRNAVNSFLSGAYGTGERDKYRTRLERGALPNTTEIYISHRGVSEVYANMYRDSTVWQARPPDPGLEAEFLRRLMVRFGVDESRAKAQLAAVKTDSKAKLVATAGGGASSIELAEPFDRAWRRVGLVLDRVGFTVEDRDRSKGFYFVRYVDPEDDAVGRKNESFFAKLMFWRDAPDPKAEQYRVFVKDRSDSSEVQVLNREGGPDTSDTARRILSLLEQQLK
ncbi:MAG TPA: outer membrane protein assembly factor BamC [Burkholderiales bacterium]|nr:outer membrane protein assembly factor BamC [Burkholderiales bacterium]